MRKKILLISGEFIPYTQSIGGVIRIISFLYSLRGHKIKVISLKKKIFGYFGLKKYISHAYIKYINIKINKQKTLTNFFLAILKKLFSNILYLFAIDYNFFNNKKYLEETEKNLEIFKPDYILISAPPFSLFRLINKIRQKNKKVKIILDYRDGWTQRIKSKNHFLIKKILESYEKKIICQSNFVLCATKQIYDDLKFLKNKNIILLRIFLELIKN